MFVSLCAAAWAVACGTEGGSEFTEPGGGIDSGKLGTPPPPFAQTDGSPILEEETDASLGSCDAGCAAGARCKYGVCVPNLGSCSSNDSCPGDSYCDPADGTCVPYGVPPSKTNDPTCQRPVIPGVVTPTVQCEWGGPPPGDPTDGYIQVYSAPMVADLNLDLDANKLQPSVVLTTWKDVAGERIGMLRVFDGRTCAEQMNIGGPTDVNIDENRPAYGTQIAIGDLDGDVGTTDGHPEIVVLHRGASATANPPLSVVAFGIEVLSGTPRLVRRWEGHTCPTDGSPSEVVRFGSNTNNYGPGLFDLDDDGKPEVVVDSNVFDSEGCLLNPPSIYAPYLDHGVMSTVADVDLDGLPDLVRADGVWGWEPLVKEWIPKSWFVGRPDHLPGHVAVADVGRYSQIPGHPSTDPLPEVIVVSAQTTAFNPSSTGTVRVQTITGDIVFGPVPLSTMAQAWGGHGGPPTASDFDGDGQVEFAAAANEFYTIYDPDCDTVTTMDGGVNPLTDVFRPGGKCDRPSYMGTYAASGFALSGILWARPSQDYSSSETGSSIFDFNGDGKAEAVYRDECYLRVYEGATGNVVFSAQASSGTGQELPVIVDVDGDFATEIVVARATNNPACPATDPLLADGGVSEDGGTPTFTKAGGFVILKDPQDRWAASRPVWNQHAYSITNVTDDARIPRSSEWKRNWEQPGMNNFRQNTQGDLGKLALADLTAQIEDVKGLCSGASGSVPLRTRVCNRGTNPVQDGVTIGFFATPQGAGAFDAAAQTPICSTKTPTILSPGNCVKVTCTGFVPAGVDVIVVTDPGGEVADCHPGNNRGASARVLCSVVD